MKTAIKKWSHEECLTAFSEVPGFTRSLHRNKVVWQEGGINEQDSETTDTVVYTQDGVAIYCQLSDGWDGWSCWGSTHYKSGASWYCFDRRGIDCSFTLSANRDCSVESVLQEQLARIRLSIAAQKQRNEEGVEIQLGTFGKRKLLPEEVARVKENLKVRKSHDFLPHGMGIGITLTTLKPRRMDSRPLQRVDVVTEKVFNVGTLWITTFDAD